MQYVVTPSLHSQVHHLLKRLLEIFCGLMVFICYIFNIPIKMSLSICVLLGRANLQVLWTLYIEVFSNILALLIGYVRCQPTY